MGCTIWTNDGVAKSEAVKPSALGRLSILKRFKAAGHLRQLIQNAGNESLHQL